MTWKTNGVTDSGKVHAYGLPGVSGLEPAPEVVEDRLSVCTTRRFLGEVKGALRVVVVLRA